MWGRLARSRGHSSWTGPFDVKMALQQVCPEAVAVIDWVGKLDPTIDSDRATMAAWVVNQGKDAANIEWATQQL